MIAYNAIAACYKKYFIYSGQANRSEFWWFIAFMIVTTLMLRLLDLWLLGVDMVTGKPARFLSLIFVWISFPALLAVGWRRMRDVGLHGWYILVPAIFSIVYIALMMSGVAIVSLFNPTKNIIDTSYVLGAIFFIVYIIMWAALTLWLLWCLTRPTKFN